MNVLIMDLISKIQKFHYSKLHFSALTVLFAPISFLYFIFISTKNFLYKINLLKSKKVDIKVICVGNLTTGGVGKTPVVIELANYLANSGEKPAIITRGYKGKLSNKFLSLNHSEPKKSEGGYFFALTLCMPNGFKTF